MIDWHSHVLPGIDDGSQNIEESLALLKMLSEQGVDTVVATPHFIADNEAAAHFLERRQRAFDELHGHLQPEFPRIIQGAEVKYYPGISRMEGLDRLTIGESGLLLLEMPMMKWTEYTVREVIELSHSMHLKVVLAHIDRYWTLQSKDVWSRFYENEILMQVNADFFLGFLTKGKAMNLLRNGAIHFLGSDCHNLTSRQPRIGQAFSYIEKKFGCDFLSQMHEYGMEMLMTK